MGRSRWSTIKERLAGEFWVWPSLFVVGVIVLAWLLASLDDLLKGVTWTRFPGGPESARSVLSSIAGAMITFTGLVFSVTVLVLQLASQQFSPRVLRTFLRDRITQLALATFTGTFTYALIVLRQVTARDVPSLSVSVAVVLVLASVAMFVIYISHMADAIRISSIITRVADEARDAIERLFPASEDEASTDGADVERWPASSATSTVRSPSPGVLEAIDVPGAIEVARRLDVTLVVRPVVGDFLPEGAVVFDVHGGVPSEQETEEVAGLCTLASERSLRQDVAFAFRQLADIAERALSPSTNDATTAVQSLDQMHDLLRRLAPRPFPPSLHRDDDGIARLVMRPLSWEDLLALAVTGTRRAGDASIQVHRRLRSMLLDLLQVVPDSRRAAVTTELDALEQSLAALDLDRDRELAAQADSQGLGG